MRESSIRETFDIVFKSYYWYTAFCSTFCKYDRVMNSLGTWSDFFSSHEDVVGACPLWVISTQHRIERPRLNGITMKHIEICLELLLDNLSQRFLCLSWKILVHVLLNLWVFLIQPSNSFLISDFTDLLRYLEWLERILLVNHLQEMAVSRLQILKYIVEDISNDIEYLEVVLFDCHLKIQSHEFCHVSIGKGVLSSEYWSDFKDSSKVTHNGHLLVELWGLCEAGFSAEVVEFEYFSTSFRNATD